MLLKFVFALPLLPSPWSEYLHRVKYKYADFNMNFYV